MNPSRYNFRFQGSNGAHLVFNALTGALARLTPTEAPRIEGILAGAIPAEWSDDDAARAQVPTPGALTGPDVELREKLVAGGFLVPSGVDERDVLKARYQAARFDRRHLKLTVLPTLDCNFRCSYCYEHRQALTMNTETQEAVINFVRNKMPGAAALGVSWYGGEPLLALDIIERLSAAFRAICEERHCTYSPGGIVTNGYLLSRSVAVRLKQLGISSIQVTLDGPREVHDRRRPLAGGAGTFDRILDNLAQSADLCEHISIRVNSDHDNAELVIDLLETIERRGLKGRVSIYFARVMAHTAACAAAAERCFVNDEFSQFELRLAQAGLSRGFDLTKYPRPRTNYCEGDHINAFVIAPDGYLYKCWSEPGERKQAVGHVADVEEHRAAKTNFYKWMAWDVFDRPECLECDVLPVCMGGCPYLRLRTNPITGTEHGHGFGSERQPLEGRRDVCDSFRFNLIEMLRIFYANHNGSREKTGAPVVLEPERR